MKVNISGLQEAQHKNLQRIEALKPSSFFGRVIKRATIAAHRYLVSITHVWMYFGGGLRASERLKINELRGEIYLDRSAVNPRGQKPAEYGPYEFGRGGSHDAPARTVKEQGPTIARNAIYEMRNQLV